MPQQHGVQAGYRRDRGWGSAAMSFPNRALVSGLPIMDTHPTSRLASKLTRVLKNTTLRPRYQSESSRSGFSNLLGS